MKRKVLFDILKKLEAYIAFREKKNEEKNPFLVLLASLLSHRTKDEVTEKVMERVKSILNEPQDVLDMKISELEHLIYPVGFYRKKAKILKDIASTLVERYNGEVPSDFNELLKIKGIGRKTANLILAEAFGKDALAVDTHVHRISNRLGIVRSNSPEETEKALKEILPRKSWKLINGLFVSFGKHICKPISPICSKCPLYEKCKRIGVKNSR